MCPVLTPHLVFPRGVRQDQAFAQLQILHRAALGGPRARSALLSAYALPMQFPVLSSELVVARVAA
eukprot:476730-Rhodomonas_salina.1